VTRSADVIIGLMLLMLAHGLRRRKRRAWQAVAALLAFDIGIHVTNMHRLATTIVAAVLLVALLYFREEFYAEGDRRTRWRALWVFGCLIVADVVIGCTYILLAKGLRANYSLGQRVQEVIYGLVGGKGTLGRPIKRSEIQQPSPYNTYVVDGLPPGPIANPGRASLEAVANPARTRDLFFVADGTGGHAFSDTYDQHQKNVAKLRAMERQIQNDTVEPSDEPAPVAAGAPLDANPTAATAKPVPAKKPARSAPPAAPARQGAAQSTTSPPVVQQ